MRSTRERAYFLLVVRCLDASRDILIMLCLEISVLAGGKRLLAADIGN